MPVVRNVSVLGFGLWWKFENKKMNKTILSFFVALIASASAGGYGLLGGSSGYDRYDYGGHYGSAAVGYGGSSYGGNGYYNRPNYVGGYPSTIGGGYYSGSGGYGSNHGGYGSNYGGYGSNYGGSGYAGLGNGYAGYDGYRPGYSGYSGSGYPGYGGYVSESSSVVEIGNKHSEFMSSSTSSYESSTSGYSSGYGGVGGYRTNYLGGSPHGYRGYGYSSYKK